MIPIMFWLVELDRRRREQDSDIYGTDLGLPPWWFPWALLAISVGFFVAVVATV